MEKAIFRKDYKPYLYIGAFLAVFAIMFAVNFILPIQKTILVYHFNSINARIYHWSILLICSIAIYYIFKVRKINFLDLIFAIAFGCLAVHTGWNGYITSITTALCYY
ncbi:MAG: hypothetical protein II923_05775, partial [Campylobacter sp.]|nr:hypothetical protein [Campylobacter sp.]